MKSTTDRKIQFHTFDEAVSAVISKPGTEFVGLNFTQPFTHLGIFIINSYSDEPENINVFYEGGTLFDSCGEEDLFDVADAPANAKKLLYALKADLGQGGVEVMGMTGEYVLQEVLPGLKKEAKYRDHGHFMQIAGAEFQAYWRNV